MTDNNAKAAGTFIRQNKSNRTRSYRKPQDPKKIPVNPRRHNNKTNTVKPAGPQRTKNPSTHKPKTGLNFKNPIQNKKKSKVPPLKPNTLRIIPICGVEWVGTNMTAIEYNDQIIVIDAGFGFSNPDTPGVNYTIPDVTYLEERKHMIKAIIITHGHMDHVGGIPYVIEQLGNPPIYTREFGAMFIKGRLEEFKHLPSVDIRIVEEDDGRIPISEDIKVKFFGLTHSIPDSTGVIIYTPLGGIVSTGDVRVENNDGIPTDKEIEQYKFFKDENILLLTMDSTGVIKPGWSLSENVVGETIDKIIKSTKGRLFIAAFSSQVERMLSFISSAKKHGKYIVIDGRSMKANLAIAEHLKLGDFSHVISPNEAGEHPDGKLVFLVTGAQGETYSFLDRLGRNQHRLFKLKETDTVVLSSSIVPGNDWSVKKLKDNLYRGSYEIITYTDNQVHASGHGKREELAWIHRQIPYKFFMPIHGDHFMLRVHQRMAIQSLGVKPENIVVPENGSIIEFQKDEKGEIIMKKLKEKVPAKVTVVDGKYIGPIHEVVMRDRMHMHEHGMFVIVVSIDMRSGRVRKSPDIISRGFIYLRESGKLLNDIRELVRRTTEAQTKGKKGRLDFDIIKKDITKQVSKQILRSTDKEPIVIPVILSS